MQSHARDYFSTLAAKGGDAVATDRSGARLELDAAIEQIITDVRLAHARNNKIMVIGNGGSAAIASHIATDYAKNGGFRTQAFNDGATLTCLGNDLGYDQVFAAQVRLFAQAGDLLIAISSSGQSPNILSAVDAACAAGCRIVTLSGFLPDNPLRGLGDVNLYVASNRYGFVELSHMSLCHMVLDFAMGFAPTEEDVQVMRCPA